MHIVTFVGLVVILWGLAVVVLGVPVTIRYLAPFSGVVGVVAILWIALEHRLWRIPMLHSWFIKRPNLRGTWKVTLQSDWVDPQTEKQIGPINCYMAVTQSLSMLQMRLMTAESESWFVADCIRASPSGEGYQVVGVYLNKPQLDRREKSAVHWGALVLDTHGPAQRPTSLSGEYWTDRKTRGKVDLGYRVEEIYSRFDEAAVHIS